MNDSETGVVVKAIDMANDMATAVIALATTAVNQFQMEREMAGDRGDLGTSPSHENIRVAILFGKLYHFAEPQRAELIMGTRRLR